MKWTLILYVGLLAGVAKATEDFNSFLLNKLKADPKATEVPYVNIKNGTIKGFIARAVNNKTIHSYMHIPFAKPPVGDLRFKAPESQDGWDGVLDGTRLTPACPQFLTGFVPQNEDCLYLNVYSSRTGNETKALAPVMVFLYGGAFVLGETSYYTGHRLLANDVVLGEQFLAGKFVDILNKRWTLGAEILVQIPVVPNYRVSLLGFLATGDEVSPGNYGLKDQNLALRWVQENIAAFGGDPDKVTIFGESAGAACAIFHLLSPVSHGLFRAVIAQSGTAITPWALNPDPVETTKKIAKVTGCPDDNSTVLVNCLRERPIGNLTTGYLLGIAFEDFSKMDMGLAGTNAVVEPDLPGAFLTRDPYELLVEGNYPDVPVVLGATAEEGGFFLGGFYFVSFGNHYVINKTLNSPTWMREEFFKGLMTTYKFPQESGNVAVEEALALAFVPDDNRLDFVPMGDGLIDLTGVMAIKGPVLKTADLLSQKLSNVYLYSFEHRPNNPDNSLWFYVFELVVPILGEKEPPLDHGVIHGDDLMYLFNLPFAFDQRDEAYSALHCELWTNFATDGYPHASSSVAWPKYSWRDPKYYVLNEKPSVATDYSKQWIQ